MLLTETFLRTGRWLFRWRSFLPLVTVGLFTIAMRHFSYPQGSHYLDRLWEGISFSVSLFGLAIRIFTVGYLPKGTSGRTTSNPKASVLNTTGMYSIIRHPLYLGNFFVWLGISMFLRSLLFSLAVIFLFFLYYERIIFAEEKFLQERFSQDFLLWAGKTPLMFPRFRNWCKPVLPFSWKTALKREYSGLLVIAAAFTCLEIAGDLFYLGKWQFDWVWVTVFLAGLTIYVVLRTLKKRQLLNVEGR